jgi:hypothetical protein
MVGLKEPPGSADIPPEFAGFSGSPSFPPRHRSPPLPETARPTAPETARSKGTVSSIGSVGVHTRSTTARCSTCVRGANGRIKRDPAVRREFQHQHPCPATGRTTGACPSYVVDHIVPLKPGGAERPENTQWQTVEAAKAKDKIE